MSYSDKPNSEETQITKHPPRMWIGNEDTEIEYLSLAEHEAIVAKLKEERDAYRKLADEMFSHLEQHFGLATGGSENVTRSLIGAWRLALAKQSKGEK